MTVPMVPGYDDGPLSPEVVLVDPALRAQLAMRESVLPGEPPQPVGEVPVPTDVSEAPIASGDNGSPVYPEPILVDRVVRGDVAERGPVLLEIEPRPALRADRIGHVPRRSTARRLLVMVGLAVALSAAAGSGVFAGLLLSGHRVSVSDDAAATPSLPPSPPQVAATTEATPASPSVSTQLPITQATTPASAPPAGVGGSPTSRVLAWAPVANATGYTVEITRNGESIFSTTTSVPHVSVPSHWRHAGRTMTLSPGTYHWYVWPVVHSGTTTRRSTTAIVASNLQIAP